MNFKKSLTPAEFEAILEPQLRLFLSVDVVGSTAFKYQKSRRGEKKSWLNFIHAFYTGFPGICLENVSEVEGEAGMEVKLPRPYLWKAQGDELIFGVLLRHQTHVRLYLKAFRLSLIKAIESSQILNPSVKSERMATCGSKSNTTRMPPVSTSVGRWRSSPMEDIV